jgi:integrase/recombinase XerD
VETHRFDKPILRQARIWRSTPPECDFVKPATSLPVKLDPTTTAALAGYVRRRHDLGYHALSEIFFVNERGGPLDAGVLGCWFGKLTHKARLRPIRAGVRRASLHSFRHSFAVRRLRVWHEAGLDVQALLPTLSVYLGHVRPEDTYWYLTATPDLLRAAGSRFTPDGVVGGAP